MTEWINTTIGEQVRLQRGFDITKLNQRPGRVPVVSCAGILSYHDTSLAKGPGVILGRKGNGIGRAHFVPEDYWPHDTTLWVTDFKGNEPKFIYYFFTERFDQMQRLDVGSANPTLNRNHVHPISVTWPPLPEQKAIASVLGALDDKMELNRRMNATLEAMARALFQSWFVDFDPVRAQLDGRKPAGLDPAVAALFPGAFQDSELGNIPQGWRTGSLGQIGTNVRRSVQPQEIVPGTPYIALEHMPRRSISLNSWEEANDLASSKSVFRKDEILFGKLRPYFHKIGLAPLDGVCSTDILVITPRNPDWLGFLLGHLSSEALIQFTDLASTGTKMPRTSWRDISRYKVVLPPDAISGTFSRQIRPMLKSIARNIFESRTLANLRDTLLPKLLSGELSVKNIESQVAAVV